MSSRRKSSNPCMVRVVGDLTEQKDSLDDILDMEISSDGTEKEESETSETPEEHVEPQQDDRPDPDQQVDHNPEQSDQELQSDKEVQIPAIEDSPGEKDSQKPESNQTTQTKHSRGYECKYCPFVTQNLNDFKDHVDSSHPNVILNPLYLCAVCNFNTKKFDSLTLHNESQHPGETNFKFKRITLNSQTVLEQTIEGKDNSGENHTANEESDSGVGSMAPPCVSTTVQTQSGPQPLFIGCDLKSQLEGLMQKDQITAVNINGTVIIPEPTILQGLSHVTPMLQRPPNFHSVPKIAVPLNTTKYNPLLDDNLTLITSFNKFPYPTHAELSWLTAASKHPEEQIKVWFTTQRLKQGITWSPEEVEEARKKMFNGSIPPAHHTFTILPTSPVSQASATPSQQPVVHTTVQNLGQVQIASSSASSTNSLAGVTSTSSHTLKRSLPPHLTTALAPEAKRPVMAVAPHSGDAKDKVLMAPPPPPPPPKDRHSMAPPAVPLEAKRHGVVPLVATDIKRPSAAVPLLPPSLLSKGKILSALGSPKTKPVVSLPSIVFPESLTRPMIAPLPIFAPPFKNSLLIPRDGAKDKPITAHPLPAADPNLPNSPPLINPPIRRPPIIQSIHAPAKAPSQVPGFPFDGQTLQEQQGVELKTSCPRGDKGVSPLSEANGTSRFDRKWSRDQTLATHNGVLHMDGVDSIAALKPDFHHKSSSVLTQFPLLERMKGKSAKQLKVLEENFLRNSFPTHGDVDHLVVTTRLSHQEIESWFAERRALRDNLEQALLNSMGTKRGTGEKPIQHQALQLNGVHKTLTTGTGPLNSPPPPSLLSGPNACPVPPDGRPLALLKDDLAQTRWPCPEEQNQPDGRSGLVRAELARWFTDSRLQGGANELAELFHGNGLNGGRGPLGGSPENAPPGPPQRCQDGALINSSKVLEVELGWLMEQRVNSFNNQQHDELAECFAGRLRQQSATELKKGGQNGGAVRDVFGNWLEDGQTKRGRGLLLDRDHKMDDASRRLTG